MAKMEKLRRFYGRLSPFEKACVSMRNAFGRRREAVEGASAASGLFEGYWKSHWMHAIVTVCGYASFHALLSYFKGMAGEDGDGVRRVYGWIRALERLERETGAPFTKGTKIFGLDICAVCREAVRETDGGEAFMAAFPLDFSENYAALRSVWDAFADRVDEEDAWRKLPPASGPEAKHRRAPALKKAVRKRTEGVRTDPPKPGEDGAEPIVLEAEDVLEMMLLEGSLTEERYMEGLEAMRERREAVRKRREGRDTVEEMNAERAREREAAESRDVPGAALLEAAVSMEESAPAPKGSPAGLSDADVRRQLERRRGPGR